MINLQNPSIPIATNPIEIDRAIVDLQTKLNDNLAWLTHGYGRAYKNLDVSNGRRVYYPEVYLGTQGLSERYVNISPDNDKMGQCFFLVRQEQVSEFQQGHYSFLTYNVAIIFSLNLKLIDAALLTTDYFLQNAIAEVRQVLTRMPTAVPYRLGIDNVDLMFEDVFSDFQISDAQVLEKAPLTHFRFNCTVSLQEECVAVTPPIPSNGTSFSLDGVNEYIETVHNVAYDLPTTDPFSISAWCKMGTLATNREIISKYDTGAGRGVLLMLHGGVIRFGINGGGIFSTGIFIKTVSPPPIGVWFLLTATYDGSINTNGLKVYFNNILQSKTIEAGNNGFAGSIVVTGEPYTIGYRPTVGTFSGLLNSIRIWKKELTASDVTSEYNSGTVLMPALYESDLIVEMVPDSSIWNGVEYVIDDLTGITVGYKTINMEEIDRVADFPI